MAGAGCPKTKVSKKWLMRYIDVAVSLLDRFTLQSNDVVTSYAVSQMLVNSRVSASKVSSRASTGMPYNIPSMMYGTEVKSALESMKVTNRFPESMRLPRVGQPLASRDAEGGE